MQGGGWPSLHAMLNFSWTEPCPDPCPGSQARSRAGSRPGLEVRQEALWLVPEIGALGWDSMGSGPEFSHLSNGPFCQPLA